MDIYIKNMTVNEAIESGKQILHDRVADYNKNRKWLEASVDCYQDSSNQIKFLVLEGSPHKGFITAKSNTVDVYDDSGKRIKNYINLI